MPVLKSGPGKARDTRPLIAVTMGDPAGVGPEIILKALRSRRVRAAARVLVVGSAEAMDVVSRVVKIPVPSTLEIIDPYEGARLKASALSPGRLPVAWARAIPSYIEKAVALALSGEVEAITTAPINKAALKKAGFAFPGHTEFLAKLTDTSDFVMMLGGADLKVALVTIHEALSDVPGLITKEKVLKTIEIVDRAFKKYYGLASPRIGVLGLNPHAGEGGLFGDEERVIIAPAIKSARKSGIEAIGPVVPDTAFIRAVKGEFDLLVCMYHDQGLGPLKLRHFDDGINTTLGLPVIRTSVDHGTAYDLAWKGSASARSMVEAIVSASAMARAART